MTKSVLDACILFPSITREILIGAARAGFFQPLWSDRILEEWRRAALRHGPEAEMVASGAIALLKANWPDALVELPAAAEDGLWLPDPDDVHVLAAAIVGTADELVTANTRDFPLRVLGEHGIHRRNPDEFLLEMAHQDRAVIAGVVSGVLDQAAEMDGRALNPRTALKKAGLPRLAKYLAT